MIGQLTGTVVSNHRSPIIIDVQGVGYAVHATPLLLQKIQPGIKQTLYIHTHVRDDAIELFGFLTESDLVFFNLLLTVSGIGPKTASSIMDRGASAVQRAVVNADTEFFSSIPRLGKKNAQKIIIELKTKFGSMQELDLTGKTDSETKEIVDALAHMGFDRRQIMEVLPKIQDTHSLEEKIRAAIRYLGKK